MPIVTPTDTLALAARLLAARPGLTAGGRWLAVTPTALVKRGPGRGVDVG